MENTGILVTIIISIVLLTLFLAGIVFVIRSVRRNRRTGVMDEMEGHEFEYFCAELLKASHRRYTTGFYFKDENKQFIEDSMPVQESEFVALVTSDAKDGFVEVEMRNKFSVGDELEILSPDNDTFNKKLVVEKITNSQQISVDSAKVVQEKVLISCQLPLKKGDILRR